MKVWALTRDIIRAVILIMAAVLTTVVLCPAQEEKAVPVGSHTTIKKSASGYQLYFNDAPYFIKGAGANINLKGLAEAGANSTRTWNARYIQHTLDQSHALGLSVTIGLWMGQERHGFDYTDRQAVRRQFENARRHVKQYQEHPALLMWAVGNEAEWIKGTTALIYQAINDVAKMIKQEDPHHPTMIVLAELGDYSKKIDYVKKYCPDIDILGINSFGGLRNLPERLQRAGWTKPYVVTEFGPPGPWEADKTSWGAEIEPTSTEKAKLYFESYMKGIHRQKGWCLGSYVFFWGQKFETTATWFSMLLRDHSRLASAEIMTAAWSKKWPSNRCPTIKPITSRLAQSVVRKGGHFEATVEAKDPEGDPLTYRWELMSEKKTKDKHGLTTTSLKPILNTFVEQEGSRIVVQIPSEPGFYRLFVTVTDHHGNAANANTPFKAQ